MTCAVGAIHRVSDRIRAGHSLSGRTVVRVHQPVVVPGRPDLRSLPPTSHCQHAQLPVRVGDCTYVHGPAGARQLHGMAGRGVLRAVRQPRAAGPATNTVRGIIRPAGPGTAVDRVRGHRFV